MMKFLYHQVPCIRREILINPNRLEAQNLNEIIKPLLSRLKGKPPTGKGVVVIPQDPNALVEMLSLRIASLQAGNTGVRNEIVEICEELKRQGVIDNDQYKNLML